VVAHGAWLVCQDAQLDFLRYMLSTYPNLYVDLAATFQYFELVSHENLRDLFMSYPDRILYGTDIGRLTDSRRIADHIERYVRTFRLLETDEVVEGGFFGMNPARGLNLPAEVLEKVYYRNAARIYPALARRMSELGYLP
jgi:predicted TIM-barrel fold metal-dependent hydrolase